MSDDSKGRRIPASATARKSTGTRAVEEVKRTKQAATAPKEPPVEDEEVPEDDAPSGRETRQRHPFGVKRLDSLLGGGLKAGTSTLLHGPVYVGKEHLARMCVVEAVRAGIPAIHIHTDATADAVLEKMDAVDPVASEAANKGLLHLVDCFSRPIDAEEPEMASVHMVDGPMDLNGISVAVNEAQRRIQADHDTHVLVIDSISTLITYADPQTVFRFLQVLLGKSRLLKGTAIILIDAGMHSEPEVQMFRHLTAGSIELRDQDGKFQLRVLGISNQEGLGWIDYRFPQDRLELTGSFAPGRIR